MPSNVKDHSKKLKYTGRCSAPGANDAIRQWKCCMRSSTWCYQGDPLLHSEAVLPQSSLCITGETAFESAPRNYQESIFYQILWQARKQPCFASPGATPCYQSAD